MIQTSAFLLAQRNVGVTEAPGILHTTPLILAMLRLDSDWPESDEVPWCSAFVNFIAWNLRLPRSKSLAARSWLGVGQGIRLEEAVADSDVVVLARGSGGHVGFYAGRDQDSVLLLGGNQGNGVSVAPFARDRVLGVRRLVV